jgi:hypothetical protein
MAMSQCSRVLEVLRDGKGHSIGEIHERAGTMRLNSRVADLRRMGYHVIYYRENGLHTYQLIDGTVPQAGSTGTDGSSATALPPVVPPEGPPSAERSSRAEAEPGLTTPSLPAGPVQLSVWEAAA